MFTVLLVFGLTPLLAMGLAGFVANRGDLESHTRSALETIAHDRMATVELFLDARLDALALAAESQSVSALASPTGLERVRQLLQRGTGGIVDLALLDDAGKPLAYSGPYGAQAPEAEATWFQEARVLGRCESDVFLGLGRFPHMLLAVARREGGTLHVLKATIDARALGALLRQGGADSGADIFILDRAGEYQAQNGEAHQILARAEIDRPPLHPGVRVTEAVRDGRRELVATAWLRRDRWLLVARRPLPSLPGQIRGHPILAVVFVLGFFSVPPLSLFVARHRLRQIQNLEAERAALLESVAQSQKMATIGRLAATVAHEINNPLAVIDAQLGVISDTLAGESTPFARDVAERLKKIEAQIERSRKVTHRLLGLARRVGPDLEPVDVQAALEDAVGFVEKATEASGTRFVRNYQLDVPMIRTSLSQMQQVFLNLINNAVDALGGQGEVVLTIRRSGDGVAVAIADNGPGIPEEQLRHVFEPFYTTKAGHHAGLGLAICREAMQNLGGDIEVASRAGEGTTFTLRFPLAPPEDEVRPAVSAREPA
jgi:two-component system NtrC family sensor kinase